MSISLRLFSRLKQANPPIFIADLTQAVAKSWKRSIYADGGYWSGSFTLTGDAAQLAWFFYENLGCHVEERSNGFVTWEGLVYEMELTVGKVSRQRSLSVMANAINAHYTDTTGTLGVTALAQSAQSIKQYGQREEMLLLDSFPLAAAQARRDRCLTENQWPYARTTGAGVGSASDAKLVVTVCGYVFTANWRYLTALSSSVVNVSQWVSDILNGNEFLLPGRIHTNTLQVIKKVSAPVRNWDKLKELTDLGDASGAPWRLYVDTGRYVTYEAIDPTPSYKLQNGQLVAISGEDAAGSLDPWRLRPAVIRDLDYPVSKIEYGSWLSDARDFYAAQVEVAMIDEKPTLKTELYDENAILDAQAKYQKQIAEAQKKGK